MLIQDGILFYRKSGRTQKVIKTRSERDAVLDNAHHGVGSNGSGNHIDAEAMLAQIEPYYKWSDTKLDIDDWVC